MQENRSSNIQIKIELLFIDNDIIYNTRFRLMVFNTTFNNILVISWRSVSLVGQTGIPKENHRPVAIRTHNFSGDRH
jgi:hypothetical protein